MKIGLDIGSTSIKCVVIDENNNVLFRAYQRHFSQVKSKMIEVLSHVNTNFALNKNVTLAISGTAGMGLAQKFDIPFVQEVFATQVAAKTLTPNVDTIIELGGEDAKILFLTNGLEVRMNASCAGGTGSFIDQMSTLLKISVEEMSTLAANSTKIYPIASRCGVFAKGDIHPLINQGAKIEDICASIFYAVANQAIAGLAQGRTIAGNVLYLGGPLTFCTYLKHAFDTSLQINGFCPDNSLLFVAFGTAFSTEKTFNLMDLIAQLNLNDNEINYNPLHPLFQSQEEYDAFRFRHSQATVAVKEIDSSFSGIMHVGIDAGSTTIKVVAIDENTQILYNNYQSNSGNPLPIIKDVLINLLETYPYAQIATVTTTGYGEDLIKQAFRCDFGIVETIAHYSAARHFVPDVDFIIDIGGQDMKCFRIANNSIDDIFLNEACSSGCGSFLQTLAQSLGYQVENFAQMALFAAHPVDLGSRCSVFMNSSVKQAQKDGARIDNISAGLSISLVRNALYKVIRARTPQQLGQRVVVQGGVFCNDAVLRAFEMEMGIEVIRPSIAGIMGAFGSALQGMYKWDRSKLSGMMSLEELRNFSQKTTTTRCKLCTNNCDMTINIFSDGNKLINGNRCSQPLTGQVYHSEHNLYQFKRELLRSYQPITSIRGNIGIPMAMNMYELFPFWYTFFTELGFCVHQSPVSTRELYLAGQGTIPNDSVCFPAKLSHGHIKALSDLDLDAIFYPCMTYNLNEDLGSDHYNCPSVAYYPEVLAVNCPETRKTLFINDYIGLHSEKEFIKKIGPILGKYFKGIRNDEIQQATRKSFNAYSDYLSKVRTKAQDMLEQARQDNRYAIILAGRPYHIDPEVSHGIDDLITSFNMTVISEEAVSHLVATDEVSVLNQWTYHARLYNAAEYCVRNPNVHLIQLTSFGCGIDTITSDQTRTILKKGNKLYTNLKIDEITNLGAVKIRLRSLFAALETR